MYLSRIVITPSRHFIRWLAYTYNIHQDVRAACKGEQCVSYRIEPFEADTPVQIIVHYQRRPDPKCGYRSGTKSKRPGSKAYTPSLTERLISTIQSRAYPVKQKHRWGRDLLDMEAQIAWLARYLKPAARIDGGEVVDKMQWLCWKKAKAPIPFRLVE